MNSHSVFKNPDRARQLLLFDGLEYDSKVAPMDLDGLIEYHNKKRVLLEVKLNNTPVPNGERIALERMVNDFALAGKEALAIIADHKVFNPKEDVHVRECIVRELYHSKEKKWRPPRHRTTVADALQGFIYGFISKTYSDVESVFMDS